MLSFSIRIYVDLSRVQEDPLRHEEEEGRRIDRIQSDFEGKGTRIKLDQGRQFIELSDLFDPVPAALAACVEEVTMRGTLRQKSEREPGLYALGKEGEEDLAKCELTRTIGDPESYWFSARAKTLEAMRELYQLIRGGRIRPTLSYEDRQTGESRALLEHNLGVAMQQVEGLEAQRDGLLVVNAKLSAALNEARRKLPAEPAEAPAT